jgi:hypothetical protein
MKSPHWRAHTTTLAMACWVSACAAPPQPAPERPARLGPAAGEACLAAMSAFASEQTGQTVELTAGAFASSATLWLEAGMQRGANGRLLDGRSRNLPEVFKLVSVMGRCEIVHERSGARRLLDVCTCNTLPAVTP